MGNLLISYSLCLKKKLFCWILARFERNTSGYILSGTIVNRHVEREKQMAFNATKKIGHDSWLIRAVELSIRVVYETFNQFNDTARNWCLHRNMPIFDLEFAFDHSRLPCFPLLLPILCIIKLFASMVALCTVAIPTDRKIAHRYG